MTAAQAGSPQFGSVLREWRNRRHRSQLVLASEAGVSQRHISFLETGRSKPSREMVIHLGIVLDVPLRTRNQMLIAAGYAPVYAERSIDDPDMADIRRALDVMLDAHDPFPAYIVDRHWNLVLANRAATALITKLPEEAQAKAPNVLRLLLHPDGMRSAATNWTQAAAAMLVRVEREVAENPGDFGLAELLEEVRSYPGMPMPHELDEVPTAHELIAPLNVTVGDESMSFFTTIATLAGPRDVTLEELRLETLLPANAETDAALRALELGPSRATG